MKPAIFDYKSPGDLDEAVQLLSQNGDDSKILAGGQSLMPTLNMRLSTPKTLIDITRLQEIGGISFDGEIVRIGALTRQVELANSPIIAQHLPLIADAIPHVADIAVR